MQFEWKIWEKNEYWATRRIALKIEISLDRINSIEKNSISLFPQQAGTF